MFIGERNLRQYALQLLERCIGKFFSSPEDSQRGSCITPRPRGGVIILPALPRQGNSSRGFAGRSANDNYKKKETTCILYF